MTENQELKLQLLKDFAYLIDNEKGIDIVDFCRRAYAFMVEGDFIVVKGTDENGNPIIERVPHQIASTSCGDDNIVPQLRDGIYFIYEKEGRRWFEMFTGQNEDIDYIECVAFKFGMVSLKVWRCDIKDCAMTTKKDDAAMPYVTKYSNAAHDFSGKERTKDLLERGLGVDCEGFNRGWYIPAIGELYVMYLMKDALNEALKYAKRQPLEDTWYWSSTEYSATNAWSLYFTNGYFITGNRKTNEGSVRPVSAFDPYSL